MRIAILYICTGKYSSFFEGFYKSTEEYLLQGHHKHYFVWSDDDDLAYGLQNVTLIHRDCLGFPQDSLFRFEMFLQAEDELREYDYIFFFNSNALICRQVGEEILPDETGLSMGVWVYSGKKSAHSYTYERRPKSLAYVAPYGKDYVYYMGGLNGGTSDCYLNMIRELCRNIREDFNNGIIAVYHDESHINAYMRNHKGKCLGREFCLPEEWITAEDNPKIIFRNKVKVSSYFNKGCKRDRLSKYRYKLQKHWNTIRWYLKI